MALVLATLVIATPLASASGGPDFDRPDNWFDAHVYHHYADLTSELQQLAADHPSLVSMNSIGTSVRGRSLWCMRITDPSVPAEGKLQIYVDGEHHGNEYLGGELAILLIHHLLEDQDDPLVEQVLKESIVYITPMLNPDGNARDQRANYNGIDLNRHYPFEFTPGGSHGQAPGVEPEVAANIAFMETLDLDLYLTLHTGIVTFIYPWGYTKDPCPDVVMFERYREIAESFGISYGQSSVELYVAKGTAKDYAYGILGVPGFTYEVDNSQFRQISRREDIADRLSDELDLMMAIITESSPMMAHLTPMATSVSVSGSGDGAEITVALELDNPSYSPANNTTITVNVHEGNALVATHIGVLDVPAESGNNTEVRFKVDGSGEYVVRTFIEYSQLLVENASVESFMVDQTTVTVEPGLMGGGGAGWTLVFALAVVGVAMTWWGWRHGWRPGWAVKRALVIVKGVTGA